MSKFQFFRQADTEVKLDLSVEDLNMILIALDVLGNNIEYIAKHTANKGAQNLSEETYVLVEKIAGYINQLQGGEKNDPNDKKETPNKPSIH
jgi:hypothetical protein